MTTPESMATIARCSPHKDAYRLVAILDTPVQARQRVALESTVERRMGERVYVRWMGTGWSVC